MKLWVACCIIPCWIRPFQSFLLSKDENDELKMFTWVTMLHVSLPHAEATVAQYCHTDHTQHSRVLIVCSSRFGGLQSPTSETGSWSPGSWPDCAQGQRARQQDVLPRHACPSPLGLRAGEPWQYVPLARYPLSLALPRRSGEFNF